MRLPFLQGLSREASKGIGGMEWDAPARAVYGCLWLLLLGCCMRDRNPFRGDRKSPPRSPHPPGVAVLAIAERLEAITLRLGAFASADRQAAIAEVDPSWIAEGPAEPKEGLGTRMEGVLPTG